MGAIFRYITKNIAYIGWNVVWFDCENCCIKNRTGLKCLFWHGKKTILSADDKIQVELVDKIGSEWQLFGKISTNFTNIIMIEILTAAETNVWTIVLWERMWYGLSFVHWVPLLAWGAKGQMKYVSDCLLISLRSKFVNIRHIFYLTESACGARNYLAFICMLATHAYHFCFCGASVDMTQSGTRL